MPLTPLVPGGRRRAASGLARTAPAALALLALLFASSSLGSPLSKPPPFPATLAEDASLSSGSPIPVDADHSVIRGARSVADFNAFLATTFAAPTVAGGIDVLGALFLNNAIWPRPQRNVDQYLQLYQSMSGMTQGGLNFGTIVTTLQANGGLGLVIFIVIMFLFFIASLFLCVCFPCCRACRRCGGRGPRQGGYSKCRIIWTSVLLLVQLTVLLYAGATGIMASQAFNTAITETKAATTGLLTTTSAYIAGIPTTVSTMANTIDSAVTSLQSGVSTLPIDAQVIQPTIARPFGAFQSALDALANNVTIATTSTSMIQQLVATTQAGRSSLSSALTDLQGNVTALNSITIDGSSYSLSNPPSGTALDPANVPDLSSLPSLSSLASSLSGLPNVATLASTSRTTYSGLISTLSTTFSNQVNTMIPPGSASQPLRSIGSSLSPQVQPMQTSIVSIEGQVAAGFQDVTTYNNIRNDVTKAYLSLLLVFFAIGIIGVVLQKRKCMFLLMPVFLLGCFLAWPQAIVYFMLGIPINELCYSRSALLSSTYTVGNLQVTPLTVLNSCQQGGNLLNVALTSGNSGTTLLAALGQASLASNLASTDAFKQTIGVNTTALNTTLQTAFAVGFPNTTAATQAIQSMSMPPASTLNAYTAVTTAPFSQLTQFKTDVTTFAASLTPASINNGFTESGLTTKLNNFNSAAVAGNSGWVAWTYTDIVNQFVVGGATFSASTHVTNSNSNPQNGNIDTAFNNLYPDVRYKYYALLAIQAKTADCTAIKDRASALILPLHENLAGIVSNATALQTALPNFSTSAVDLNAASISLNAALPAFTSALATLVINWFDASIASLRTALVNVIATGTACGAVADSVMTTLQTTCTTTLGAINGSWMAIWLIGTVLFTAFGNVVQASLKLTGWRKRPRIAPLPGSGSFGASSGSAAAPTGSVTKLPPLMAVSSKPTGKKGGIVDQATRPTVLKTGQM